MINIQQGREEINSNGGNILIGALLQLEKWKEIEQMQTKRIKRGDISHADILKVTSNLLALGRSDFSNVDLFKEDPLFLEALGISKLPSAETLRQRLNDIASLNKDQTLLDNCNAELLAKVTDYGIIKTQYSSYIPLDIDVSVMLQPNCKKEGVSWTYHNENGYAPIFCHIGTDGYMLANELREGSQHSSKGAVEFIDRCLQITKKLALLNEQLLVRVDSAHDDTNFISTLLHNGVKFLIKRNLRRENREQYLAMAKHSGTKIESRDGKNIYRVILSHRHPKGLEDTPIFMVVEVIERCTDVSGTKLLFPAIEVSAWWTNLPEDETACIDLYRKHATSEQFHSELKSDMDLESLPSGKFATNTLILNLAALSYNCLRFIGQESLNNKDLTPVELEVKRRRIHSVLQDLIYIGCKFTKHANRIIVKFGRNCPWFNNFQAVYARCQKKYA